ncbi:MAG: MFS transporter [Planctomycetaceae bacterium]
MSETPRPRLSPAEPPTNVRWTIFGLGCGTSWFLYLHRYTFGIISPAIKEEWGLTKVDIAWLNFTFSITYAGLQVPAGLLGDILGAHLFLSVTIIGWSLALALHTVPYYATLYPVRVLFGAMQAGCYSTLSKMSKTWFPRSVRTSMQGWIASFFGRMGGATSNLLFASVLIFYFGDWQRPIYILSAAGVLFGVVFAVIYRNSPRRHARVNEAEARLIEEQDVALFGPGHPTQPSDVARCPMCGDDVAPGALRCESCGEEFASPLPMPQPPKKMTFSEIRAGTTPRSRSNFGAFLVQQFTSAFADGIYMAWIPLFLRETHGLEFKKMGILASMPLFGGACGGAFGGFLNDVLIRRLPRRWARTLVGLTGKMTAFLLIFVALLNYEDPTRFCVTLFFVKFFSDWSQPTVWGTVTDIGGKSTATVFGFNNMVGGFGGILSPLVMGYIAQFQGWTLVFIVVGVAYLISSLSWLLVDCTIPLMRDEDERGA